MIASVSTGCKKDDKEPDTPKAENLSPKFDAGFAAALQAEKIVKDAKYITADEIASGFRGKSMCLGIYFL